jgi:hypothetical protein
MTIKYAIAEAVDNTIVKNIELAPSVSKRYVAMLLQYSVSTFVFHD